MLETIGVTYIVVSMIEWVIHSQVMHGEPNKLAKIPFAGEYLKKTALSHHSHHKDVNIDMSLKEGSTPSDLYFPWDITIILGVSLLLVLLLIFTPKKAITISVLISLIVSLLWNSWHPNMHDSNIKITLREGMPRCDSLASGPLYRYLKKHHTIHHSQKGVKYNHNIILPGFDNVMNTSKTKHCIDNRVYCSNAIDDRCLDYQKLCL